MQAMGLMLHAVALTRLCGAGQGHLQAAVTGPEGQPGQVSRHTDRPATTGDGSSSAGKALKAAILTDDGGGG